MNITRECRSTQAWCQCCGEKINKGALVLPVSIGGRTKGLICDDCILDAALELEQHRRGFY